MRESVEEENQALAELKNATLRNKNALQKENDKLSAQVESVSFLFFLLRYKILFFMDLQVQLHALAEDNNIHFFDNKKYNLNSHNLFMFSWPNSWKWVATLNES